MTVIDWSVITFCDDYVYMRRIIHQRNNFNNYHRMIGGMEDEELERQRREGSEYREQRRRQWGTWRVPCNDDSVYLYHIYMMRSKYSRFLVSGMVEPGVEHVPAYVLDGGNEWKLDTAIDWQNGLKASPDLQVCIDVFDTPEPTPRTEMEMN